MPFCFFRPSPGLMARRKDEILKKRQAKRRNNARQKDEITKRRRSKRRKLRFLHVNTVNSLVFRVADSIISFFPLTLFHHFAMRFSLFRLFA